MLSLRIGDPASENVNSPLAGSLSAAAELKLLPLKVRVATDERPLHS
jgi:hypothetical protein